jgi:hypothetical protein
MKALATANGTITVTLSIGFLYANVRVKVQRRIREGQA